MRFQTAKASAVVSWWCKQEDLWNIGQFLPHYVVQHLISRDILEVYRCSGFSHNFRTNARLVRSFEKVLRHLSVSFPVYYAPYPRIQHYIISMVANKPSINYNNSHRIRLDGLTAVIMSFIFWLAKPCRFIGQYKRFEATYILHLKNWNWRKCFAPKRWFLPTSPLCVTNQKANIDSNFQRYHQFFTWP
jgi:hypothetical protein